MGYGTTRTLERVAAAVGMLDGRPSSLNGSRTYPMAGCSSPCRPSWKTGCCQAQTRSLVRRKVFIPSRRSYTPFVS